MSACEQYIEFSLVWSVEIHFKFFVTFKYSKVTVTIKLKLYFYNYC